jgi:hypothetical protein
MSKQGNFISVASDQEGADVRIVTETEPFPVAVLGAAGAQVDASRYGQLITGGRKDNVLVRFEYNNSTEDVSLTTSGTGVEANAGSMASVSPGTGVGAAAIASRRVVAYRPGHEAYGFFTTLYGAPEANTYQRHGLFDVTNGFFFGYEDAIFGATVRDGGVDLRIPQSEWNADTCDGAGKSRFKLNHATLNQYKITYGWLGSAPVTFWIYSGSEKGWILAHVYDKSNSITTPTIGEPSQGILFETGRTTGTGAAIEMKTSSWGAGTIESFHSHAGHRTFGGETSNTLVAATPTHIASFYNKPTFQGKANKVAIEAVYMGVATDGNKSVLIRMYRDATITGPDYIDIDADNSVTAVSVVGTLVADTGKYELTVPLAKVGSQSLNLGSGHIHLELLPGETMTIVGFSSGASDVTVSFRWEEYFS